MNSPCEHVPADLSPPTPSADGCEDCLRSGGRWVHLRLCQECGHVGCCNDSPNRHASGHYESTGHALIRSFEPGEDWWSCYIDQSMFAVSAAPPAPSHS